MQQFLLTFRSCLFCVFYWCSCIFVIYWTYLIESVSLPVCMLLNNYGPRLSLISLIVQGDAILGMAKPRLSQDFTKHNYLDIGQSLAQIIVLLYQGQNSIRKLGYETFIYVIIILYLSQNLIPMFEFETRFHRLVLSKLQDLPPPPSLWTNFCHISPLAILAPSCGNI